ncbi:MAG TPA: T9SS type A sorting domain-containing protein [Bacteroidota bacterium]|nr:T9SS type A sorting domain-containing protein [Bacteroidota bacterium]
MRKIHAVAVLLLLGLASSHLSSQTFTIPIRVADNGGHSDTLWFGQDSGASYCMDPALGESELPPKPPSGYFDVRWVESRQGSICLGLGMKRDYRPGDDVYKLELQAGYGGFPFTLSWSDLGSFSAKTITLTDIIGGAYINVDMKSQTSLVVTNSLFSALILTVGTPPPPAPLSPSAATEPTFSYDQTSAMLSSIVNPNGTGTECWFEWGTTDAYGYSTPAQSVGSGSQSSEFSQTISGLVPQTGHHYRVVAQNSAGTTYGTDRSFTTIPAGTPGERLFPLEVTDNGARSRILWLGVHESATYCIDADLGEQELPPAPPGGIFDARFVETQQFSTCFGTGLFNDFRQYLGPDHGDLFKITLQPGNDGYPMTISWPELSAWYAGSITLRDVTDGSLINIDMKSRNSFVLNGSLVGPLYIISGTPTPPTPSAPYAITYTAEFTTQSSTRLAGSAIPGGDTASAWFEWGMTDAYGDLTPAQSIGDGNAYVHVSADLTGLYPRTTYHYRIVARNSLGTTYGTDNTFMTIIEGIPGETLFSFDVGDYDLKHKLIWLGVAPDATSCIDDYLGEVELPPVPPYGIFDARSVGSGGPACLGQGLIADYHVYQGDTQVDTFVVSFQSGYSGYSMNFSWDDLSGYFSGAARMTDPFGGLVVDVDMTAQTTYSLNDSRITSLLIVTGPAPSTGAPPSVITGDAGPVSQTGATLSGSLNPNGIETTYWFEYGTTTAYGNSTSAQSAGNGTGVVTVTQSAGGLSPGTSYHCRIVAENGNGIRTGPDIVFTTDEITSADAPVPIPGRFALAQNYPNPFNPATLIGYSLPVGSHVTIAVFNVFGQAVRILVDGNQGPGVKSVVFDAAGLPSGIYYCRMTAESFVQTRKLAFIR